MEVGVFAAKNKEKLVRKNFRAAQNKQTERAYGANDCRIKPAQFPCALAASECRDENVGKKITEHRKNHRQSPERAHFSDRARAAGEKADEKNRDLSLQTIENSIGGEFSNKTKHGGAILGVFGRAQIDDTSHVLSEHGVLQEQRRRGDGDGHAGIEKKIHERDQNEESRDRAGEIDALDTRDIGAQARDDAQDAER